MDWNTGVKLRALLQNLCLFGLLLAGGGCAAATLATAGTVLGTAATALSTGADVYHLGKLDSVELARLPELVEAVHQTCIDLKLTVIKETKLKHGWYLVLNDDQNTNFEIKLDGRTETMCRCRVDMGWFGSEPTARLVLFRIRAHLPVVPEIHEKPTSLPAWPEDPRGKIDDDSPQKIRHP